MSNPRYLYALLHGVGCRLIASLLARRQAARRGRAAALREGGGGHGGEVLPARGGPGAPAAPRFHTPRGAWRDPLGAGVPPLLDGGGAAADGGARRRGGVAEKVHPLPAVVAAPGLLPGVQLVRRGCSGGVAARLNGVRGDRQEVRDPLRQAGAPAAAGGRGDRQARAHLAVLAAWSSGRRRGASTPPPKDALPSLANAFANYENVVLVDTVIE
jgi:hypothetical protein